MPINICFFSITIDLIENSWYILDESPKNEKLVVNPYGTKYNIVGKNIYCCHF